MIDLEKKQRIVIIGAGPTALGAAHRLHELGVSRSRTQVIVLEQTSKPGGLATSERDQEGFLWDMGGHVVFSHYEYFTTVLDKVVTKWNKRVRAAYAFMKGSDGVRRFIPYPVQNNIHVMDKTDCDRSLKGLEKLVSNTSKKPTNFDEWLLMNFGEGLCDIFMRKYNKKVWTVDSTEMNAVWVGERVAVPDINKIKEKILLHGEKSREGMDSDWGPNHLFRFPQYEGTGAIWKAVAEQLPRGWFHYNHEVTGINLKSKTLTVSSQGKQQSLQYDYLISTTPLDMLLNMISDSDTAAQEMKSLAEDFVYSHTHVMGIGLTGQPPSFLQTKSWMYFPDSDSPFYRVTVFSSYSDNHVPEAGKYWSLMCEAAEPKQSHSWTKEYLLNWTIAALVEYGFIMREQVVSKYHHHLHHGYPVPSLSREKLLDTLQPWLESNGVFSRGRFGGWRYEVGNQDHSFMQGVEVADLLARQVPEETYQDPGKVNALKASDRSLACLPETAAEVEYVISHYNENLNWLAPFANSTHIYHKGPDTAIQFKFRQWENLPNVGRESHTYLHHIIKNYDHLSDVTVFSQGSVAGHKQFCHSDLFMYVRAAYQNGFSCIVASNLGRWGRIYHIGKWKQDLIRGNMRRANETLGEFCDQILGSHPDSVKVCLAGCFSATKQQIRKHPLESYKKMISYVQDHPNPEEGHYFERLWYTLISY